MEHKANLMVINILRTIDSDGHWKDLSPEEKEIVKVYGWVNLKNMMVGQRPNYITNMRSIAKTLITNQNISNFKLIKSEESEPEQITWESP